MSHDLIENFRFRSAALKAASQALDAIRHPTTRGVERQHLVREYFESLLPDRIGIADGEIWAANGQWSRQGDLIFYDRLDCPRLITGRSSQVIAVESCAAVLEVKTTLTPTEITRASANVASAKRLRRGGSGNTVTTVQPGRITFSQAPPLTGAVLAFRMGPSPRSVGGSWLREQNKYTPAERIDLACVVDEWFIVNSQDRFDALAAGPDSLMAFSLELMRRITASGFGVPNLYEYVFGPDQFLEFQPYNFGLKST